MLLRIRLRFSVSSAAKLPPFTQTEALLEKEIAILVALNDGDGCATAWGCDLTYDYVKINGDYRT